jgi:hypothetical protein
MAHSTADLASSFGAALGALRDNRTQVNQLDGFNGNHGDNMVHNVGVIQKALQSNAAQPPSAALQAAAKRLQTQGRGGTSQYYARGLSQAASQLSGQSALNNNDVMTLVQSVLGAVPAQSNGQAANAAPAQSGADSVLGALLGMAGGGGQPGQSGAQPTNSLGLDDVIRAGESFVQAKQAGSDNMTAITQAAMSGLMGSQPLQSGSPQAAAGGLLAQSVLGALLGRK